MKKFNRDVMDILESVVVALVAVMIIFTLVCRIYIVDGPSMNSTLAHGDRMLVSQLFYTPKQGDIVCFVAEIISKKYWSSASSQWRGKQWISLPTIR